MDIIINGTQKFMDFEIPVIEGGFGEGKRCLIDKSIAEIHGMEVFNIRKRLNDNINRFKEGTDIIDLKRICDVNTLLSLGYSKQSITQAEHIYALSERGYAKLIKIMDTDLAWDIHDRLIDEYFTMREVINSSEHLKANLLLKIYKGGQDAVVASKKLTELEVKEATKPLLDEIECKNETIEKLSVKSGKYDEWLNSDVSYKVTELAECVVNLPTDITGGKVINDILVKAGIIKLNYKWTSTSSKRQRKSIPKYVLTEEFKGKKYAYTKTCYVDGVKVKVLGWTPKGAELVFDILEDYDYVVDRNTLFYEKI